jgi:hypothetical protein
MVTVTAILQNGCANLTASMPSNARFAFFAAQQAADPVLEQLDPPRRAAVVMALLALVLTGLLLVTCVMLGAHWVRRLARHRPAADTNGTSADTARNRRLRESLAPILPPAPTNDTIHGDLSSGETKIEPHQ